MAGIYSYVAIKDGDVIGIYGSDRKLIGTVDVAEVASPGSTPAFLRVLRAAEPTELRNEIPPRRGLTVKEAAKHLAISQDAIRALIREGHIKPARLGPQISRIDVAELDAYMEDLAASPKALNLWSRSEPDSG